MFMKWDIESLTRAVASLIRNFMKCYTQKAKFTRQQQTSSIFSGDALGLKG